jgi:hypothetical protein
MKKLFTVLALLLMISSVNAQPPKGKAKPGTIYGSKVTTANSVDAEKLPSLLKEKDTLTIKLKATVLDACASKGCWMTLKLNDKTSAFVKMKDYAFFVPQDIIGKTVVVDGISYIKTTSVEDLKHYAEDAKKSQQEIDAIVQPEKQVRVLANGILVIE